MKLIYSGSVKDLYQDQSDLVFKYSNRYSIFDWGQMPDEIPQKGEALASMAVSFFEFLKAKGMCSHFLRTRDANSIVVKSVNVIRPTWQAGRYDYSAYASGPTHCLVPFEVIFRKHLGLGNSLQARLQKNPAYLSDLGLSSMPTDTTRFDPALVEFSTKLEVTDRYLSKKEIVEMNVVTDSELQSLREEAQIIAKELELLFSSFGVQFWDGKVEFAFQEKNQKGDRSLMLVDSIGPDELRLTYEGLPLSKELLRQIYTNSTWNDAVKKSKELARERQTQDWKKICKDELKQEPQKLSAEQIEVCALLYRALANEVAKAVGRSLPFSAQDSLKLWHTQANVILGT
jgi:phosphoribosylaminoimidazole-succinocarboxamide synthase